MEVNTHLDSVKGQITFEFSNIGAPEAYQLGCLFGILAKSRVPIKTLSRASNEIIWTFEIGFEPASAPEPTFTFPPVVKGAN
jgi:hypothetical protein